MLDASLRQIPAKWAVARSCDENVQPLQLICLKNLREGLASAGSIGYRLRKVKWREVIRHVRWQLVDSDLRPTGSISRGRSVFFPRCTPN